ncbi:unnamed protein product [Paramecium octaurelia]|uniref:Uncharacterized protein n=1 Tax=Paramecium octaurelia TaxID=43137 RepID=A0A8S1U713_PAROT|nr:unnamed protein product [Paramecium octaurelia]
MSQVIKQIQHPIIGLNVEQLLICQNNVVGCNNTRRDNVKQEKTLPLLSQRNLEKSDLKFQQKIFQILCHHRISCESKLTQN